VHRFSAWSKTTEASLSKTIIGHFHAINAKFVKNLFPNFGVSVYGMPEGSVKT
jgi:hypothetical protein